jgi:hypothetical protein
MYFVGFTVITMVKSQIVPALVSLDCHLSPLEMTW